MMAEQSDFSGENKTIHRLCDPCKYNDTETEAKVFCAECDEHLCSPCSDFHRRSRKLRDHELRSLAGDHASVECSKHDEFMCKTHGNKKYKYFCIDHHIYCCSKCLIDDNHRFCKNLKTLEGFVASKHYSELKDWLNKRVDQLHDTCKEVGVYEKEHKSFLVHAKEFFEFSSKFTISLKDQSDTTNEDSESVQMCERVNKLQEDLKTTHVRAKDELCCYNAVVDHLQHEGKSLLLSYSLLLRENKSTCGEISNKLQKLQKELSALIDIPVPLLSKLFETELNAYKVAKPQRVLLVGDFSVISKDTLLTVIDSGKTYCTTTLADPVTGLAAIKENKIAVISGKTLHVLEIDTSAATITELAKVSPEFEIQEVTCFKEDKGYACFCLKTEGNDISIMKVEVSEDFRNLDAKTSFKMASASRPLTRGMRLCCDGLHSILYVSFCKENKLQGYSLDGVLKWSLTNQAIREPMGLSIGPNNLLYVCCFGIQDIVKVDHNGQFIGVCVGPQQFLRAPMAIHYSSVYQKYAVCDNEDGKELKVFTTMICQ